MPEIGLLLHGDTPKNLKWPQWRKVGEIWDQNACVSAEVDWHQKTAQAFSIRSSTCWGERLFVSQTYTFKC